MKRSIVVAGLVVMGCGPLGQGARVAEEAAPGKRVVVLTAVEPSDEGLVQASTTSSGKLVTDTWALQSGGAHYDHGRSCELKVSHTAVPNPKRALLRFALPASLPCASIISATLNLTTAQLPSSGYLTVLARKVTNPWTAGPTGAAGCRNCALSSGTPAPFAFPNSTVAHSAPVGEPCASHSWPVTSMVVEWCSSPATNFGVLLEGVSPATAPEVNFHSLEAPSGWPTLTIVY